MFSVYYLCFWWVNKTNSRLLEKCKAAVSNTAQFSSETGNSWRQRLKTHSGVCLIHIKCYCCFTSYGSHKLSLYLRSDLDQSDLNEPLATLIVLRLQWKFLSLNVCNTNHQNITSVLQPSDRGRVLAPATTPQIFYIQIIWKNFLITLHACYTLKFIRMSQIWLRAAGQLLWCVLFIFPQQTNEKPDSQLIFLIYLVKSWRYFNICSVVEMY